MFILSHVLLFISHRFHHHLYSSSFFTDRFSGTLTSSLSTQIPMQFMSDCRKDKVAWRLVLRGWGGLGSSLGFAIVLCSWGRHLPLTVLNFTFEWDIYFFIPTSPPSPLSPLSASPPSPPLPPLPQPSHPMESSLWQRVCWNSFEGNWQHFELPTYKFQRLARGGGGRGWMLWCHWVLQTVKGGLLGCARWVI